MGLETVRECVFRSAVIKVIKSASKMQRAGVSAVTLSLAVAFVG